MFALNQRALGCSAQRQCQRQARTAAIALHHPQQPIGLDASSLLASSSQPTCRWMGAPAVRLRQGPRCFAQAASAVDAKGPAEGVSPGGPDLILKNDETGTTIYVFGVEHLAPQPHIGEWIMRNRPQAVVVETALGPEHGAMPGNIIGCKDQVVDPAAAFFLRMYCQIGTTLNDYKDGDFTESPLWNQVRSSYNGEQLAYIGAFAAGVPLVYGDRPKDITYRRLLSLPSLQQLDQGYEWQAIANYRDVLGLAPEPYDPEALPVTEQIMMMEREAVMLKVLRDLCHNALGQAKLQGGAPQSLALVLGSGHLQGIEHLWRTGHWKFVLGGGAASHLPTSVVMTAPPLPPASDPNYGLRRGLMEAMLRLSVTVDVLQDLVTVLGDVPEPHALAHGAVLEVYGSQRMGLACLPPDMLKRTVSSYNCDFHEELQVMRDMRPAYGGPGYSEDMVTYVRALNFELD